jgi:hypothetical protein
MKEAIWTYVDSLDDDGKVQFFQRGVPYKRLTLEQIMFRWASWRDFKSFAADVGWKPVEAESIAFPSGAVLKTQSGQIVDRVQPEKSLLAGLAKSLNAHRAEMQRAPLTWNTRTPFDPWGAGFVVNSSRAIEDEFRNLFAQDKQNEFQRLGETSDPLHASALLKG